jgi:SAM-dependent methyltransferase
MVMSEDARPVGAGGEVKTAVGALFDSVADVYDSVVDYFGRFGRRLVEAARVPAGADVLDLACGRGAVLEPALAAVGERGSVLGIDVAPAMVSRLGADLAQRAVANVEVRVGDAEHLELPDASFDVVFGGFMIFFPPEPPRVLGEIRRVLRPGGRVALSIYDGAAGFPFQAELESSIGAARREASGGRRFNELAVLCAALSEAGLRVGEEVEMRERFRFTSVEQVERWQRSTGVRRVLESLDDDRLARYRGGLAARLEPFWEGGHFELEQRAVAVIADVPT